jgi:hypothetical protein
MGAHDPGPVSVDEAALQRDVNIHESLHHERQEERQQADCKFNAIKSEDSSFEQSLAFSFSGICAEGLFCNRSIASL